MEPPLAGAPNVLAKDLEPLNRNDGPMVVPGRYTVRLTIGERSQTHAFDILPDPRIKTSAGDLEAQFVFLNAILAKLVTVNATINDIDAMLEQVANLDAPDEGTSAVGHAAQGSRARCTGSWPRSAAP